MFYVVSWKQITSLFVSFTNEFFLLPITNGLSKQLIVFIIISHVKYILDLYESGKMPDKWNFRAGCIEQNNFGYMCSSNGPNRVPKNRTWRMPGTDI